ncbi:hypothetical protein ACFL34_04730 [Candidatus Sumerlaeota bacterium]
MTEKNPAELVKAIREAMGLTQEQFVAQTGEEGRHHVDANGLFVELRERYPTR